MEKSRYFCNSFTQCRKKFISKVHERYEVHSHQAPYRGAYDENLYIDEVLINPGKTKDLLIITSGVHGVEGYIGSGCQTYFLEQLAEKYPKNSFLLIHAVNPYGFSSNRRVNENNVDINRNFLDQYDVENKEYEKYHTTLTMENKKNFKVFRLILFILFSLIKGRKKEIQTAISGGQYSFENGLFFGGKEKQWSSKTWEKILKKYEQKYSALHLLDIHTGLGKKGVGHLLSQNIKPFPAMDDFFGKEIININADNKISASLLGTITSTILKKEASGNSALVLEFGTYPPVKVLMALCRDNWGNEQGSEIALQKSSSEHMKNCFYIDNDKYKNKVLGRFEDVIEMYTSFINRKESL